MKKLFFVVCFSVFLIFSCDLNRSSEGFSKSQQIQLLEKNGYFPVAFARNLAILELYEDFSEINDGEDFDLSQEPNLIYNNNGTIYKYEFAIYNQKGSNLGIAVVSPNKEDYAFLSSVLLGAERSNSLKDGEIFIAGDNYPFEVLKSSLIRPKIEKIQSRNISNEEQFYSDILFFDEDEFNEMGIASIDQIVEEYQKEIIQLEKEKEEYWNNIFSTYDYTKLLKCDLRIEQRKISPRTVSVNYIIPNFNTSTKQYTIWIGPCVPSAMARWYRGVYSKYFTFHIPENNIFEYSSNGEDWNQAQVKNNILRLSANSDGGLFYDLCEEGGVFKTKKGGVTGDKYNNMIKRVSQKEYTTIYTAVRSTVRKNILERKQPVFLTSKLEGGYHCVLAAGVRGSNNSYYYYILDNGSQTGEFTGAWVRDTSFLVGGFQIRQR